MPRDKARSKAGMSVQEAGKRGGAKRFAQLGPEGMRDLGRRGGRKVAELVEKGKRARDER